MKTSSFTCLFDLLAEIPDETSYIEYLETVRRANGAVSHFDPQSKVCHYEDSKYMCGKTEKYFNVKTSTVFHGIQIPSQKWFMSIYLVTNHKKGISSCQLARGINITQKSAWFMLQKIRERFCLENEGKQDGEVELDEMLVGGKNKKMKVKIRFEPHNKGRS